MNLLVTLWRGRQQVMVASVTDGEVLADLKDMAADKGYRVHVQKETAIVSHEEKEPKS